MRALLAAALALLVPGNPPRDARVVPPRDARVVHGMTISCQTWGWEWGSDGFADELGDLSRLGVNWVAIHPYAAIRADGRVEPFRGLRGAGPGFDPDHPPEWITRPIREAHARGLSILVIPHLAYWGSPTLGKASHNVLLRFAQRGIARGRSRGQIETSLRQLVATTPEYQTA